MMGHSRIVALSVLIVAWAGCSSEPEANEPERIAGRHWVSHLPSNEREVRSGFFILDPADGDRGILFRGTGYRVTWDLVHYEAVSESAGTIDVLEDQRKHRVRGERCPPREGFDYCIRLHGDPQRIGRYYSKREWERGDGDALLDPERVRALLEDDD